MNTKRISWQGVFPAMTTAFKADLGVDHESIARHASCLVENGCTGIVALGSLGESATLKFDEKVAILRTCVGEMNGRAPVVAGIASLSTLEAVELAKRFGSEQSGRFVNGLLDGLIKRHAFPGSIE